MTLPFDPNALMNNPQLERQALNVLERYFSADFSGMHYLPDTPFVGMGVISGGLAAPDAALFLLKYRSLAGRAELKPAQLDGTPIPVDRLLHRMGLLSLGMQEALENLNSGHAVMTWPGGEPEAYRQEPNRISWTGKTGSIRLALQTGVPIVPIASSGAHRTFLPLAQGREAAQWLHLPERLGMEVLPVSLGFPWGLMVGPAPYIPLPSKITISVLKPISLDGFDREDADNDEVVQHLLEQVQHAINDEMAHLAQGRKRNPFRWGRKK